MNSLKELVGQTVNVILWSEDEGSNITVKSKVLDVDIDSFHFDNKWNEPIYIQVQVEPIGNLPKGITYDDFETVYLDQIVR